MGILVNSFVNAYRQSYDLGDVSLINTTKDFFNMYFVFDTPVYAYYSSATQIASESLSNLEEKMISALSFLGSIFGGESTGYGNLTNYVSSNYFKNIGGGLYPTYFYFWFGWLGVIASSLILVLILNKINSENLNEIHKLIFVTIIFSVPRWYLYTPLSLFRPVFLMIIIAYILSIINKSFDKTKSIYKN